MSPGTFGNTGKCKVSTSSEPPTSQLFPYDFIARVFSIGELLSDEEPRLAGMLRERDGRPLTTHVTGTQATPYPQTLCSASTHCCSSTHLSAIIDRRYRAATDASQRVPSQIDFRCRAEKKPLRGIALPSLAWYVACHFTFRPI